MTNNNVIKRLKPHSLYFFISGGCFVIDQVISLFLHKHVELEAAVASGLGYLAGLSIHFVLSFKYIFELEEPTPQSFITFAATGMAGLALNIGCMRMLTNVAVIEFQLAKLITAGLCLISIYLLRLAVFQLKQQMVSK